MENNIKNGFFNIGTGIPISINNLAKIMINLSEQKLEIIHGIELKGDVKNSQADMEFTKKTLNWNYQIELKEGLSELIKNTINIHKRDS